LTRLSAISGPSLNLHLRLGFDGQPYLATLQTLHRDDGGAIGGKEFTWL
jgi:hypothetical protein